MKLTKKDFMDKYLPVEKTEQEINDHNREHDIKPLTEEEVLKYYLSVEKVMNGENANSFVKE